MPVDVTAGKFYEYPGDIVDQRFEDQLICTGLQAPGEGDDN
jgi:hypothetical protein